MTQPNLRLRPATGQLSSVGRLAWIFQSRDDLLLLRLPLLAEIARRRHKVLAIAPDLQTDDIALVADLGIEGAKISKPGTRLNPLSAVLSRRQISQLLHAWRASVLVVEDADCFDVSIRAAVQAGLSDIYAILPALEGGIAPAGRQMSWRSSLDLASAVLVPTANDARLIDQFSHETRPVAVLPSATIDLAAVRSRPLASIANGLVVLGLIADPDNIFVEAGKALAGKCRFKAINSMSDRSQAISTSVELIDPHESMPEAILTATEMAHIVVVDDTSPAHMLLLATALAIGRPVIVTDIARYRDLVDAGANGWLVADGDATALTNQMKTALQRPDLLEGMARLSRQKAERKLEQNIGWQSFFDIAGLVDLRRQVA